MRKKTHLPHPETRHQVRLMIGHGLTEDTVGRVLGISDRTIRRHYKAELGCGFAEAEATVKRTSSWRSVAAMRTEVGRKRRITAQRAPF